MSHRLQVARILGGFVGAYIAAMSPHTPTIRQTDDTAIKPWGFVMDAANAQSSDAFPGAGTLNERDEAILAFERQWWKYSGANEQAIRELFDMSSTRYYQVLNALIDRNEALMYDPMLVKRLRRMRAERQRQRSARRLGFEV